MTNEHQGSAVQAEPDTGLACLVMLARFHNVAASPEQLAHEYLDNGRQFGRAELLLAAKQLGLKATSVRSKPERLAHVPLPAIAASNDGRFFIIAQLDGEKALIHDPALPAPRSSPLMSLKLAGDKVLVHRGLSTLDVIAIGLLGIMLFETGLSGLRTYIFAHTASRIDVELGSRLFRHLVTLPLAYFQARRVGDPVALRCRHYMYPVAT
ncbi:MAG: cysteine peptidase family C39 domain-containing protein [Pseudomonas sp.]|uniref:cysteine peptidase family C39 domain-containing protein n=1 Tax=Pseudomonas sp. TaxID=306 RepID=UPI0030F11A10